ncbi:MAG TPA: ion transporter, partial [Burkholderiaceae bacterium]|nr:ion transporter [Burkholderiaceae bacterium]
MNPSQDAPTALEEDDPIEESWEAERFGIPAGGWRRRLFVVVFGTNTRLGRAFDLVLLLLILASTAVVMADSVASISQRHHDTLTALEWFFTVAFTLEYAARLACVERPWRYARSFYGVVDLISILPTWLAFFFPELHALIDVRVLRLMRIFRILKLTEYIREYRSLGSALHASRRKIMVFMGTVCLLIVLVGTLMFVIEGPQHGFTSIPMAVYWTITTITTVGYGDIIPQTDLGKAIGSITMVLGWAVPAVPAAIVTAEMTTRKMRREEHKR